MITLQPLPSTDDQGGFTRALFDPDLPPPAGLVAWNGSDPARRFAVYRNNVLSSLVSALKASFPITHELVGEDFFQAMASVYVREAPPRDRQLTRFGEGMPAFIAGFEPAGSVPYLADIAALEVARIASYHAADEDALEASDLAHRLGADLASARLSFVASARVMRSAFAIFSLYAAHQGDVAIETVNPFVPEAVLITRVGEDVLVTQLSAGDAAFLAALADGHPLGEAAGLGQAADDAFSLPHALAALLSAELVADVLTDKDDHP